MSFSIYLIGFIIMVIGMAMGAYFLHVPPKWITVGVIVMAGLGILLGVTNTRQRDSSN